MTAEREDEPSAAIEYADVTEALFCKSCGRPMYFVPAEQAHFREPLRAVRIVNIAQVKAGWLARGELPMPHCALCGQVLAALAHYIPIECAFFPCPTCGPGSRLTPEILDITETEMGYSFTALLKCDKCSKQRRLSKLLEGLSRITKVKIGPTGVEVEVKS
jgi:uncharacterized Zn finger protein